MRALMLAILLALPLMFAACSSGPEPAQPAAAKCECAKTMPNCTCQHCKDAKANVAGPAKCDCAEKKGKGGHS